MCYAFNFIRGKANSTTTLKQLNAIMITSKENTHLVVGRIYGGCRPIISPMRTNENAPHYTYLFTYLLRVYQLPHLGIVCTLNLSSQLFSPISPVIP